MCYKTAPDELSLIQIFSCDSTTLIVWTQGWGKTILYSDLAKWPFWKWVETNKFKIFYPGLQQIWSQNCSGKNNFSLFSYLFGPFSHSSSFFWHASQVHPKSHRIYKTSWSKASLEFKHYPWFSKAKVMLLDCCASHLDYFYYKCYFFHVQNQHLSFFVISNYLICTYPENRVVSWRLVSIYHYTIMLTSLVFAL